jgi:hypothetical protein
LPAKLYRLSAFRCGTHTVWIGAVANPGAPIHAVGWASDSPRPLGGPTEFSAEQAREYGNGLIQIGGDCQIVTEPGGPWINVPRSTGRVMAEVLFNLSNCIGEVP